MASVEQQDSDDPWGEYAAGWDDDAAARAYSAAAFESLIAALTERGLALDGAAVLDFGCGTGLLTEQLVDRVASIDAVDTSPAMLEQLDAKIGRRGWTNVRSLAEPTDARESHDLVVCSSVCGFVDDYPGTVHRIVSLLAPGGLFVQWDWEREETSADEHGLTRNEIRAALTGAGLTGIHVDSAFEIDVEGQTMRPIIGVGRRIA